MFCLPLLNGLAVCLWLSDWLSDRLTRASRWCNIMCAWSIAWVRLLFFLLCGMSRFMSGARSSSACHLTWSGVLVGRGKGWASGAAAREEGIYFYLFLFLKNLD
jgi:hypothetical protein